MEAAAAPEVDAPTDFGEVDVDIVEAPCEFDMRLKVEIVDLSLQFRAQRIRSLYSPGVGDGR